MLNDKHRMETYRKVLEENPSLIKNKKVLDVGCGIGGTSRYLARMYGEGTSVTGITLSQNQVDRATALAKDRGLNNANFQVMDALAMDFPDNSFDVVWACESGEHMPDKKRYVEEMIRSSFAIADNPNAESGCGCGSSFVDK